MQCFLIKVYGLLVTASLPSRCVLSSFTLVNVLEMRVAAGTNRDEPLRCDNMGQLRQVGQSFYFS
jgi:hypothetical protein